jgi:hypothetical protein
MSTTNKILCDDGIHCACSDRYEKLYRFVYEIANDYFELSHEKIKLQRDDYMRKAKQLLAEIYPDE